jgi:hypothetical protein
MLLLLDNPGLHGSSKAPPNAAVQWGRCSHAINAEVVFQQIDDAFVKASSTVHCGGDTGDQRNHNCLRASFQLVTQVHRGLHVTPEGLTKVHSAYPEASIALVQLS